MGDDVLEPLFGPADLADDGRSASLARLSGGVTQRKLEVFCTVATTGSLTKAARLLGVTQPTLSQQLAQLESQLNAKLFTRDGKVLQLTEFGLSFSYHAQNMLRAAAGMEDMLTSYSAQGQVTFRLAGIPSVLHNLVAPALRRLNADAVQLDLDLSEAAPSELIELLQARKVHIALLNKGASGIDIAGYHRVSLFSDPYVLVVPKAVDLREVKDLSQDVAPALQPILGRSIQFAFGRENAQRLQQFYDRYFPQSRIVARARSFDLMVDLVREGLGICVAPLLSAAPKGEKLTAVNLYRLPVPPREIVALLPSHYLHQAQMALLVQALVETSQSLSARFDAISLDDVPPFIRASLPQEADHLPS